MRRVHASFLLTASLSGCIPARDNPFDPARAPDVRASVVALERINGECVLAEDRPVVLAASRGDCLALDASRTTDPQSDSFTFTYFVASSNGEIVSVMAENTEDTVVPLPRSLLGTVRTGLSQTVPAAYFGVRAKDSSGARTTALVTLALVNHAPVVPPVSPRLVPEGGYPWAPGAALTVTLDGHAVSDPDGDTLRYCWSSAETPLYECEQVSDDDGLVFSGGETWTVTVPPEPGRHLFYLRVDDGDLAGEKRAYEIRVGAPPVWAEAVGLRRFDDSLRFWTKPSPGATWLVRGDGGEEWVLLYDGVDTIDVYPWPALDAPVASIDVGTEALLRLAAGPLAGGGTRIWIATEDAASGTNIAIHDLSANGLSVTGVRTAQIALDDPRVFFADQTGTAAAIGGEDYLELVPAVVPGTPWPDIVLEAGTVIEGGGARPKSTQLWFTASGPTGNRVFALDVVPGSAPSGLAQILSPHAWREMAWFDDGRFWAVAPDAGLVLYDADHFTEFVRYPDVAEAVGDLSVDPGTGACHFTTASAVVSADTEGREDRTPLSTSLQRVAFVSADGRIGIEGAGQTLRIARTIDPDAIGATADIALANPRRSIAGGVWGIASGPALAHVGSDGRTDRYVTKLDVFEVGGVDLAAPSVAMDPDDLGGWLLEGGALYRLYETWVDPYFPEYEEVLRVTASSPAGYVPVASSSPAASPRFGWMWSSAANAYGTITTDGTFAVVATLGGEAAVHAVPSYASDELCVFSQLDATTMLHRRIARTGVVAGPVAVQVTSGGMALRSPFTASAPDVCGVVAGTSGSHLFVFDDSGVLVERHDETDAIASVAAAGQGVYWATGIDDGTSEPFLRRLTVNSAGAFVEEPWPFDVPGGLDLLP